MPLCENCYLFGEFKLYSKVGFFESRQEMVIFMLNTILNIQKYFLDFCECNGHSICLLCNIGEIFNKNLTYKIYKNCLDFNLISNIKENLHVQLNNLLESSNGNDHFLCKILNEDYYYEQGAGMFTGKPINISVRTAYLQWEKTQIENIVNNDSYVLVEKM